MDYQVQKPKTAFDSPRFVNTGTFMRLERRDTAENLDVAIYGIPFDTGVSYRPGARFGPSSIRDVSSLMKTNHPVYEIDIMDFLNIADLGDVNIVPGYIERSYETIKEFTAKIVQENAIPIALGGDHSITLGEIRAIAEKKGPISLLHFDSHCDINDLVFGEKYNHGTPFRRGLEEGMIDSHSSMQLGMRGSLYDKNEFKTAHELGFEVIPTHEIRKIGIEQALERIHEKMAGKNIFLSFDIDFVDPAYAPATGTPEVGGFTSWEVLQFIRGLKGLNFVGMDIVEVAPIYDVAQITSLLAANIIFEFLSILAVNRK